MKKKKKETKAWQFCHANEKGELEAKHVKQTCVCGFYLPFSIHYGT